MSQRRSVFFAIAFISIAVAFVIVIPPGFGASAGTEAGFVAAPHSFAHTAAAAAPAPLKIPRDSDRVAESSSYYGVAQAAAWRNLSIPSNLSPGSRYYFQTAFDPLDGCTVLFGGILATGANTNQTWVFQNSSWHQLHPRISPPARSGGAMVWDPIDGYVLLFGGEGGRYGIELNDTWSFLHGNWTELSAGNFTVTGRPRDASGSSNVAPPIRDDASLAWDARDGYAVLFGGQSYFNDFSTYGDTWKFQGGNWTQLHPNKSPPARQLSMMAYDAAIGEVILFGGQAASGGVYNDTWTFADGNWSELDSRGPPPDRYAAGIAYFPALSSVVMYGGEDDLDAILSDSWSFHGGNWTTISLRSPPGDRTLEQLSQAGNCTCLVMYGGASGTGGDTDTWIYYAPNLTVTSTPVVGEAPLLVSFSASAPNDPLPLLINWSFGDGTDSNASSGHHTYSAAGNYSVRVSVTDAPGARSALSFMVAVYPALTLAAAVAPSTGTAPLLVDLIAVASGGLGPYNYTWSIGSNATARGPVSNYTFTAQGIFVVSLLTTDQLGYTVSTSIPIQVRAAPPLPMSVTVGANRSEGSAPFAVLFSPTMAGGDSPFEYAWQFGDGSTSELAEPDHLFTTAGTFEVNLTVTDAQGVRAFSNTMIVVHPAVSVAIAVSGVPGVPPSETMSSVGGVAPFLVNFSAMASGGWSPYLILWQFGDGSTANGTDVTHTYTTPGRYSATAEVVDAIGARVDSIPVPVAVAAHPGIPISSQTSSGLSFSQLQTAAIGVAAFAAGGLVVGLAIWADRRRKRGTP